jgi:hypothetical protein
MQDLSKHLTRGIIAVLAAGALTMVGVSAAGSTSAGHRQTTTTVDQPEANDTPDAADTPDATDAPEADDTPDTADTPEANDAPDRAEGPEANGEHEQSSGPAKQVGTAQDLED